MRRSVLAALFGAAACVGALVVTEPPGPGLDPDAMSYLGSAEALVRQGSLRIPMATWDDPDSTSALTLFPPAFPLLIAVPVALGAPAVQAARGVEAAAAFGTVALVVWMVAAAAGPGAGALAGTLLLATPAMALVHVPVLSEPLCFALLALTLALMATTRHPLAYGAAAAAAGLVRYAALSAVGAALLWAFGLRGPLRDRLRRAALAALPAFVLEGAWALRTFRPGAGHRVLVRGALGRSLGELRGTLAGWLAPAGGSSLLAAATALLVGAAAVWLVLRTVGRLRTGSSGSEGRLLQAAGLLAACYAAEVLASRVLFFDNIPFDYRILSPLLLLAELAVAVCVGVAWKTWTPWARRGVAAAIGLWLVASAVSSVRTASIARDGGWGYASDEWRRSPLAGWLRSEGRAYEIFSNDPAALYFVDHRPSRGLPPAPTPQVATAFGRALAARKGALVRFPEDYDEMAAPDSLATRLGLRRVAEFPDGVVWVPDRTVSALSVSRRR